MIRWLRSSKKRDRLDLLQKQLEEWSERYSRLEESIDRLQAKYPQVTIEHVHIHQPVLEKLEFRMDGLEIEQLSGSLNLGNNFGAKMDKGNQSNTTSNGVAERMPFTAKSTGGSKSKSPTSTAKPPATATASATIAHPQHPGLESTPSGFRFTPRR